MGALAATLGWAVESEVWKGMLWEGSPSVSVPTTVQPADLLYHFSIGLTNY